MPELDPEVLRGVTPREPERSSAIQWPSDDEATGFDQSVIEETL